jgi:hypothetical protein
MITKGMMAAERQEELKLSGELAALKARAYGAQDANKPEDRALRDRLRAARVAYEGFRKRIYALHPQLAINRGEFAALNLEELRPFVNKSTALVEYAIAEEKIFLFVISVESTVGATLRGRPSRPTRSSSGSTGGHRGPPLQLKVYRLSPTRAEIGRMVQTGGTTSDFYELLLKPAEVQLAGKSKLIIIPDGPLWDVPFEALQPASVSYAISLSALREMRKRRPSATRTAPALVTFTNPTLTSEMSEQLKTTYSGLNLTETLTNTSETDTLKKLFGQVRGRSFTGAQATKERLQNEVNTATILHLASPAILDRSVPMYSFIVLSPNQNPGDDGLLKLWEVTNTNSKARVVFLPQSATTKYASQSGNALVALSWSWFVAGTPRVILNRSEAKTYMYLGAF